jgi:hypothetical protein
VPTNKDGIAEFEVTPNSSFEIASNIYFDCRPYEQDAARPVYSAAEIARSGLVTVNTCGKAKATAKSGEVVFFVRSRSWWEKWML